MSSSFVARRLLVAVATVLGLVAFSCLVGCCAPDIYVNSGSIANLSVKNINPPRSNSTTVDYDMNLGVTGSNLLVGGSVILDIKDSDASVLPDDPIGTCQYTITAADVAAGRVTPARATAARARSQASKSSCGNAESRCATFSTMRARVVRDRHRMAVFAALLGTIFAALCLAPGLVAAGALVSSLVPWGHASAEDFPPNQRDLELWRLERGSGQPFPRHALYTWKAQQIAEQTVVVSSVLLAVVMVGLLVAAILPWVLVRGRNRAAAVRLGDGTVRVGTTTVTHVTAASLAPDGDGVSVALQTPEDVVFLELDSIADARRVFRAARARFPRFGTPEHVLPHRDPAFPLRVCSLACFVSAFTWGIAYFIPAFTPEALCLLALGTLAAGTLSALRARPLDVVEIRRSTRAWPYRAWTTFGRHLEKHVMAGLEDDVPVANATAERLARGDEDIASWLQRVDALQETGYREAAPPRADLQALLVDPMSSLDIKLAAARLLKRREGEPAQEILARIADDEVRARVHVVLEDDVDDAAQGLQRRGMYRSDRER